MSKHIHGVITQPTRVLEEIESDPVKKLWRAVLTQAFEDAFGPERYDKPPVVRAEAKEFLTSYDNENFIECCENAGFDPSFVKKKVRKIYANNFISSIKKLSVRV